MSIEHLKYCTQEINNASKLLEIANSDFYKRSIARIIAIRNDDFIKIGFKVNRPTSNNTRRKDELNALQQLYTNYFKLQRDKYGAHFQDLDLAVRLETWSSIDITKADFFSSVAVEIYQLFSPIAGYFPIDNSELGIDIQEIEEINDQYNIEKYPNIASDILSLTRPNSGGIIHFSGLQTKAGVLKSIELLIDYELELFKKYRNNSQIGEVFAKLFIADLINYADNFITRSDIAPTAIQYEYALDHFIEPVRMSEHLEIINAFKSNYKFEVIRDELRLIRNKVAGHIDESLSVLDIQSVLQNFDLEKFEAFYNQIKDTFRKMCYTGMLLRTFAFSPYDKLHGVSKMIGLDIKTFDGGPEKESVIENLDTSSEIEYELQFKKWLISNDDEVRSFFYDCSLHSPIIEQVNKEVLLINNETSFVNYEYRKVHQFFKNKLCDKNISNTEKLRCLDLIIKISGTSYALNYILVDAYLDEASLRKHYVIAFGHVQNKPLKIVIEAIKNLYNKGDFYEQYESLMAAFRLDLECRRNIFGKHTVGNTELSTFLKESLKDKKKNWIKFTFSLALASEYYFGRHHSGDTFHKFYFCYFEDQALASLSSLISPLIKTDKDKRTFSRLKSTFLRKWYSTFLAMTADFLIKKKHEKTGNDLFSVLYENLVKYSSNEPSELHNYGVACFKRNDLEKAISIGEYLIKDNAYKADHYYSLLTLYLQDRKYENDFNRTKDYVLNSFNLTSTDHASILSLSYGT